MVDVYVKIFHHTVTTHGTLLGVPRHPLLVQAAHPRVILLALVADSENTCSICQATVVTLATNKCSISGSVVKFVQHRQVEFRIKGYATSISASSHYAPE